MDTSPLTVLAAAPPPGNANWAEVMMAVCGRLVKD